MEPGRLRMKKDLLKRWVLSLEWMSEGVIDGESEDRLWWEYVQDDVDQESEQDEVDGMKE